MAKKRKSKSGGGSGTTDNGKNGSIPSAAIGKSKKESTKDTHQKQPPPPPNNYDSSSSSSSDDDSLVLEGTLIRNPDASDSSSSDEDDISSEEEEDEVPMKKAKKSDGASKSKTNTNTKKQKKHQQKKKKQKQSNEPETINVEFLFCDLHTKYFHGIKTLLHRNNIHVQHSSLLSDLIIENEMVGTVLSTDDSNAASNDNKKAGPTATAAQPYPAQDENVFGFASIINVTTNHTSQTIQQLKQTCLKHCPTQHKSELTTVLSGQTARPAGFFFMERMVNVPLEITYILHEQLILDMDYAIKTADDEMERKSLDFGAFVRMAPCYKTNDNNSGGSIVYKYFDDEIFATNSEFSYSFKVPKQFKSEEGDAEDEDNMWCSVIVMTKTGHRCAMKELKKMIHG